MSNTEPGHQWKEDDVERLIAHYLRGWKKSTEYDDLFQEARVELLQKWRLSGHQYPLAHLAKLIVPFVPAHWFRSRSCGDILCRGKAIFKVVPVTSLITDDDQNELDDIIFVDTKQETPLELRAIYQTFLADLKPREQTIAYLILVEQQSYREVAPQVGLHYTSVKDVWTKALDNERRKYGVPVRHPKTRKREANRAGLN
jgi:RNA polymerase sigma factor (sigma-70 family)